MIVLVAGAHGRLGSRVVALLLRRGHHVRALVRTHAQAAVLRDAGAEAVVADLSGDVEWTAEGCNAAVFTAAARHRSELGPIDGGGAAKLAEAADRYEFTRFVLASVIGADRPERREGAVREFLAAKKYAERRLARLALPWTILRFGQLTEHPGNGRIDTVVRARRSAHDEPRRRSAGDHGRARAAASRAPDRERRRRRTGSRRRPRRHRAAAAAPTRVAAPGRGGAARRGAGRQPTRRP